MKLKDIIPPQLLNVNINSKDAANILHSIQELTTLEGDFTSKFKIKTKTIKSQSPTIKEKTVAKTLSSSEATAILTNIFSSKNMQSSLINIMQQASNKAFDKITLDPSKLENIFINIKPQIEKLISDKILEAELDETAQEKKQAKFLERQRKLDEVAKSRLYKRSAKFSSITLEEKQDILNSIKMNRRTIDVHTQQITKLFKKIINGQITSEEKQRIEQEIYQHLQQANGANKSMESGIGKKTDLDKTTKPGILGTIGAFGGAFLTSAKNAIGTSLSDSGGKDATGLLSNALLGGFALALPVIMLALPLLRLLVKMGGLVITFFTKLSMFGLTRFFNYFSYLGDIVKYLGVAGLSSLQYVKQIPSLFKKISTIGSEISKKLADNWRAVSNMITNRINFLSDPTKNKALKLNNSIQKPITPDIDIDKNTKPDIDGKNEIDKNTKPKTPKTPKTSSMDDMLLDFESYKKSQGKPWWSKVNKKLTSMADFVTTLMTNDKLKAKFSSNLSKRVGPDIAKKILAKLAAAVASGPLAVILILWSIYDTAALGAEVFDAINETYSEYQSQSPELQDLSQPNEFGSNFTWDKVYTPSNTPNDNISYDEFKNIQNENYDMNAGSNDSEDLPTIDASNIVTNSVSKPTTSMEAQQPALIELIKLNEGYRDHYYTDAHGFSIGYGHFGKGVGSTPVKSILGYDPGPTITRDEAETLLQHDLARAKRDAYTLYPWITDMPAEIQNYMIDMSYNLGFVRFAKFKQTMNYIKAGDYGAASARLKKMPWYFQTGNRAKRFTGYLDKLASGAVTPNSQEYNDFSAEAENGIMKQNYNVSDTGGVESSETPETNENKASKISVNDYAKEILSLFGGSDLNTPSVSNKIVKSTTVFQNNRTQINEEISNQIKNHITNNNMNQQQQTVNNISNERRPIITIDKNSFS